MSRYASARWAPAGTPGGLIKPRVLILHTEATRGKARPHSGLEWHFWIANNGFIDQLVDTNRRADANYRANPFAISVETEDDGTPDNDPWTPQQVKAILKLCRWVHEEHGIPLRRCNAWDGSGIGYHTMWGAPSPWTPVAKTCPGAARKAQFEREIMPLLTRAGTVVQPPRPSPAPSPPSPLKEFPMGDTCIIKGDASPEWYTSNGITKNHILSQPHAAVLRLVFNLKVASVTPLVPIVMEQAIVDSIRSV